MVPAQLEPTSELAPGSAPVQTASDIEAKHDAILEALTAMIQRSNGDSAIVVSDVANAKCVQFVLSDNAIIIDLPEQGMDGSERARASEYLRRVRQGRTGGSEPSGFQMAAANVNDATQLALEVFDHVYRLRQDDPLKVECVSL